MRRMAFPRLFLIVCAIASLSCTSSASSEDKPQAVSPLTDGPAQEIPGAVVTQKVTSEPSADSRNTHQQQNAAFAPAQDKDNRQKRSVETSQSPPSEQPPAPPQRLRIVVIKD